MPRFYPFKAYRPILSVIRQHLLDRGWTAPSSLQTDRALYEAFIRPLTETGLASDEAHQAIKELFEEQKNAGGLKPYNERYFFYRQSLPEGQVYRGFLGLADVRDYIEGHIKPHEKTLPHKVDMLEKFTECIGVQAEPVLLMYPSEPDLELIMNLKEQNTPLFSWKDDREVLHQVWMIADESRHQKIAETLSKVTEFYIADGHHRMEACSQYYKNRNAEDTDTKVLSFLVSSQSVRIHDFNRVLQLSEELNEELLLEKLKAFYLVEEDDKFPQVPRNKFESYLITKDKNYHLILKSNFRNQPSEYEELDHSIFVNYVLKEIFGIHQPETSQKIRFIPGTSDKKGMRNLFDFVRKENGWVGFALPPVHFFEVKNMADQGLIMPAKCTFIEPKIPPAVLIYDRNY